MLSILTHKTRLVQHYRQLLDGLPGLSRVTIEIHVCRKPACLPVELPASD